MSPFTWKLRKEINPAPVQYRPWVELIITLPSYNLGIVIRLNGATFVFPQMRLSFDSSPEILTLIKITAAIAGWNVSEKLWDSTVDDGVRLSHLGIKIDESWENSFLNLSHFLIVDCDNESYHPTFSIQSSCYNLLAQTVKGERNPRGLNSWATSDNMILFEIRSDDWDDGWVVNLKQSFWVHHERPSTFVMLSSNEWVFSEMSFGEMMLTNSGWLLCHFASRNPPRLRRPSTC